MALRLLLCITAVAAGAASTVPLLTTAPVRAHDPISSVNGLIRRLLGPAYESQFKLVVIPADPATGLDVFEIDSSGSVPLIRGNTGVALASGLHWYLKYWCNASVSWGRDGTGNNVGHLPQPLPAPSAALRMVSPNKYRYYMNVCTFGYSTPWWSLAQWQQEIDRMALFGVTMPLGFVGQEHVMHRFLSSLGLGDADILPWMSGPAFLPWFRMNNMYAWGGPLDADWLEGQRVLQVGILAAMRAFGMTPVLPGWSGRVPQAILKVMPALKLFNLPAWAGFNSSYSANVNVDPTDPAFVALGVAYTNLTIATYGSDHLFNADLYNEMDPASSDPAYLRAANAAMYASVAGADPRGIYVMQGWLFGFSPFWTLANARAFMSGLPINASLVLELNTDQNPIWSSFESFFGHEWIWNALLVFGGRRGLYGNLTRIATGPIADRTSAPNVTYAGFGTTPEAIEEIPLMFDLVWEMNWRREPVDVDAWVQQFAVRRYGRASPSLAQATALLRTGAYDVADIDMSNVENPPDFTSFSTRHTDAARIMAALRLFVAAGRGGEVDPSLGPFAYDLVDLTRQVLLNIWDDVHQFQALAYQPFVTLLVNTSADVVPLTAMLLDILTDLDAVLATNVNFLLGPWIEDARAAAAAPGAEADNRELNARNILTLWGPGNVDGSNEIIDYASRHWQGMIGDYYRGRWALQSRYVLQSLAAGAEANWTAYAYEHQAFMANFTYTTVASVQYPTQPAGDALAAAAAALERWGSHPADDFVAFPDSDEDGPAIFKMWNTDPAVVKNVCGAAPACQSANSNGYLKPSSASHVPFRGATLWVKVSALHAVRRPVAHPLYPPHLHAAVVASGVLDRIASHAEEEAAAASASVGAPAAAEAAAAARRTAEVGLMGQHGAAYASLAETMPRIGAGAWATRGGQRRTRSRSRQLLQQEQP